MALKQQNLAGSQVWGDLVTNAADPQDIDKASKRILRGLLALSQALKASDLQLVNVQGLTPVQLDSYNLAALRRIQERATTTGRELVPLLLTGSIKDWEELTIDSFQHGMSLHLEESTIKQQLVQEFKLLLVVGRRLVFPAQSNAAVSADLTTQVQFQAADGTTAMRTVSLMFPANCRTVVRLMEAWYDAQGGGVPARKGKRATRQPGKPENRAMATRFYHNVLILLHWQAQLLDALVQVNDQMLTLKAAGHPKWYHPSSLTSGGRFANKSPAVLARQAAHGMLAAAWHLYTGGRPAECFRMRWDDSSVPGADTVPPVWVLGLAGILQLFQDTPGTGFCMVSYHCKNAYDYSSPDPVDILPASCSGLCLAAIINMAFVVLTYLSPSSPDTPAIKQRKGQAEPEQILNNPCGYVFPYGGLQFVAAPSDEPQQPAAQRGRVGDGLADIVSDAVSGAGFIKACWAILKARFGIAGTPTPPAGHNAPSYYSFRTTMAGEVSLLRRQLAPSLLPADFWDWYLVKAGRSAISGSIATYVSNYVQAFGDRLTYMRDVGLTWLAVMFKPSMLDWNPTKVNAAVIEKLSVEQSAALKAATQRSITYRLNKTTPDVYNHLISTVQQQGSLAGMLQAVGVPLCHLGYSLSAPAEGMDLQYMQLTAARAVQVMQQHVQQVHDGCVALGWQLPAKPARPVLLQCTPDLLCADWEALQKLLEAPAVAPQAALGAAAGSVAAALAAAVGVVQAMARGDAPGATAAAEQATNAAAAALAAADGIQQQFLLAGQQQPEQEQQEEQVQQDTQEQQVMQDEPSPGSAEALSVQQEPAVTCSGSDGAPEQQQEGVGMEQAPVCSRVGSKVLGQASGQQRVGVPQPGTPAAAQGSSPLRRGAGLLVLLQNGWRGKAKALAGRVELAGSAYTHYSILQLMTAEGLLLSGGAQKVKVRVAAGCCSESGEIVGAWSKRQYTATVAPQHALLLHSQPPKALGKTFAASSTACTHTYEALYGWTPACINAALGKLGLQQAQAPEHVAALAAPPLAPNSAPAKGRLLQQAKAAVLRLLSTPCEDVTGLAAAYQSATLAVEPLQQQVSLVAGAKISRSLQQLRELHRQGLDVEAELKNLEQQLLVAAGPQQQQQPASSKRHAAALSTPQQQQPAGGKRRRVVAESESEDDEDSDSAPDGNADADVTCAATAANPGSCVDVMAGGADAARTLVGKWLRKPSDGYSKEALFGRVEGVHDSSSVLVRWDDVTAAKPSPMTEAQPVSVAAGWVAGRVSARLQQKFEWYRLPV